MRKRFFFLALLLAGALGAAGQSVLTANYGPERTNGDLNEGILTGDNVNPRQFGKVFGYSVDGEVYAQPLYVPALAIPGKGTLNVVFIATMHDSVYAFDADARTGTAPLWSAHLGSPVNPADFVDPVVGPFSDILNEIGILSTPVIDAATQTLYAVTYTGSGGSYAYTLHALDLATGAEKMNGPAAIEATVTGTGWGGKDTPVNGQLAFVPGDHLQRPALLLLNGTVYVGFGSHGDYGPWHGWVLGYNAANVQQQTSVFCTTPSDGGASIWAGGRGLASDGQDIYLSTGNGTYNPNRPAWGESVLRLTSNGNPATADWFTPSEFVDLNDNDTDLGSSGPVLMPRTNLLYAVGKEGELFLLDRGNLGEEVASDTQTVQSFPVVDPTISQAGRYEGFFVFNTAYWDNPGGPMLYVWPYTETLRSYRFSNGKFETTPAAVNSTAQNAMPFSGMTVSSNGGAPGTGILWATSAANGNAPSPGTLHAFSADNVATELWNSDQSGARDTLGQFTKFANPTVANGKVYAPTGSGQVAVYGLLASVPGIATVVSAASFGSGPVAPGELITIFGYGIGPAAPVAAAPTGGLFGTSLGGVKVSFDGVAAPLLYAAAGQVNAVVPFEVAGKGTTEMTVTAADGSSYTAKLAVVTVSPAVFAQDSSGSGQGAILNNPGMSRNSPANPAARGSTVSIYLTGTGLYTPAGTDGALGPLASEPVTALPVSVTIGGLPAVVTYQGAAPGLILGLTQVNAQVPANAGPGATVPVSVTVGTTGGRNTVTMAVK